MCEGVRRHVWINRNNFAIKCIPDGAGHGKATIRFDGKDFSETKSAFMYIPLPLPISSLHLSSSYFAEVIKGISISLPLPSLTSLIYARAISKRSLEDSPAQSKDSLVFGEQRRLVILCLKLHFAFISNVNIYLTFFVSEFAHSFTHIHTHTLTSSAFTIRANDASAIACVGNYQL